MMYCLFLNLQWFLCNLEKSLEDTLPWELGITVSVKPLLHFVAFFHVASLFSTGVDNEKALEVDNRIIFSHFSLISI